jgi:hypothetical protein
VLFQNLGSLTGILLARVLCDMFRGGIRLPKLVNMT